MELVAVVELAGVVAVRPQVCVRALAAAVPCLQLHARKLSAAAKARWAKRRGGSGGGGGGSTKAAKPAKRKGGLTAAGRRKLSMMMKARWAARRRAQGRK